VIEEAKLKPIFTQSRPRRGIKESARQVLNRLLYELRKIAAWMMSRGASEPIINTAGQGTAESRV